MVRQEPITSFKGEYSFLSNFYPCEIVYECDTYPSVEHAYQAAKSVNRFTRLKIAKLKRAADAKKEGRKVPLRPFWDDMKIDIMKDLIKLKFKSGSELAELLLSTKHAKLVEGNTWGDRFWGVYKGDGHNYLGKILMEIRLDLSINRERQMYYEIIALSE